MTRRTINLLSAGCCFLLLPLHSLAQTSTVSEEEKKEEALSMVKQIYREVSSERGERPDWDLVRSYFVEEAIIVLRTSREGNTQFTLEEFVQDFKNFYESPALEDSGFKEDVLQVRSYIYHDIAFLAVIYEASILNSDRPPRKGVDFWSLVHKEDQWKVVSVTNEIIRPGEALPPPFDQD